MKIYRHRINHSDVLREISPEYGVEIDIRSIGRDLILEHDPFIAGELFSEWLKSWKGQSLILNVKEDALEERILQLLEEFAVKDYFFLDQSFPSMQRLRSQGNQNFAARVSDLEDITTALSSGANWVWLDSFSGEWEYLINTVDLIASNGQKTCLVSPELQRLDSELELIGLKNILVSEGLKIDAVCTKKYADWQP